MLFIAFLQISGMTIDSFPLEKFCMSGEVLSGLGQAERTKDLRGCDFSNPYPTRPDRTKFNPKPIRPVNVEPAPTRGLGCRSLERTKKT